MVSVFGMRVSSSLQEVVGLNAPRLSADLSLVSFWTAEFPSSALVGVNDGRAVYGTEVEGDKHENIKNCQNEIR